MTNTEKAVFFGQVSDETLAYNHTKKNMRTSINTLRYLIEQINIAKENPLTPYTRDGEKLVANIGNFHLSQAYGGVCVNEIANEAGGCRMPIWCGHIPKRDAEMQLRAYLMGLNA